MPTHIQLFDFGSSRARALLVILVILVAGLVACNSKSPSPSSSAPVPSASVSTAAGLETIDADSAQQKTALVLPADFGHFTGDWDAIVKRGGLRALVVYNKGGFYYDRGRPQGAVVDAMPEF
jgi:hypothetical protein